MADALNTYPDGSPFSGVVGDTWDVSQPAWPVPAPPPEDAPSVVGGPMQQPTPQQPFRYLAYGSNLLAEGLARYVRSTPGWRGETPPGAALSARVEIAGWHLRFQGHSTRWDGSPATIATDPDARLIGRAWAVSFEGLVAVVGGEAGVDATAAAAAVHALVAAQPAAGFHASAAIAGAVSQYDTVVAIGHPLGALWAVTASVPSTFQQLCEPYVAAVRNGLTELLGHEAATAEIEAALTRSAVLPAAQLP